MVDHKTSAYYFWNGLTSEITFNTIIWLWCTYTDRISRTTFNHANYFDSNCNDCHMRANVNDKYAIKNLFLSFRFYFRALSLLQTAITIELIRLFRCASNLIAKHFIASSGSRRRHRERWTHSIIYYSTTNFIANKMNSVTYLYCKGMSRFNALSL